MTAMARGRRKGSTGTYFRWPPEKIAELWQDADILASREGELDQRDTAKRLQREFPDKYKNVTEDHLRQQLSKRYQQRKRTFKTLDDLDAFNADVLACLLGEKK
jgi:hypothetical protein